MPLALSLLYHVVSAVTPGGLGKAKSIKGKGRKGNRPQRPNTLRPESRCIRMIQSTQTIAVQNILIDQQGKLLRKEVAQAALSLLIQVHDSFPGFYDLPLKAQLSCVKTMRAWPEADFVKNMKALTTWPFAYFTQQDLPDVPNPNECRNLGFTGRASRWIRNAFVQRDKSRNWRFFWGLLQGTKRACSCINDDFVKEAYAKHKRSLTKALNDPEFDQNLAQRIAQQVWHGVKTREEFPKVPSNKASYRTSRSEGGKSVEIHRKAQPCPVVGLEVGNGMQMREGRTLLVPDALLDFAHNGHNRVRVVMIKEPLKARPITAGDAMGSFLSSIGQDQMWVHLRRLDCFSLIGEPLHSSHLERIHLRSPETFDKWVSGDYSAATDNLDIRLTKILFEEFLKASTYSEELKVVMRTMLYESTLCYPDGTEHQQTNGQLMGSPLSFPILCLANLVGYLSTYCEYFQVAPEEVNIRKLPVLINGDDILFKANDAFYVIWQRRIKEIGFTLSVGKSYFSKDFLTVNSKLYRVRKVEGTEFDYDFKPVTFLNPSQLLPGTLVREANEGSSEDGRQGSDPFVDRLSDALERSSDQRFALRIFLSFCGQECRLATRNGIHNLFIPKQLGGVGVRCPEQMRAREAANMTDWQLRLAFKLSRGCPDKMIGLSSPVRSIGLTKPIWETIAVKATVEPPPDRRPVPIFNQMISENRVRKWVIPRFRLNPKDHRRMRPNSIWNFVPWVHQIAPSAANDELTRLVDKFAEFDIPLYEFTNWDEFLRRIEVPLPGPTSVSSASNDAQICLSHDSPTGASTSAALNDDDTIANPM